MLLLQVLSSSRVWMWGAEMLDSPPSSPTLMEGPLSKATYPLQLPCLEVSWKFWEACFSKISLPSCVMSFLFNQPHLEKSDGLPWVFPCALSHSLILGAGRNHLAATTIWRNKVLSEAIHCSCCPDRCLPSNPEDPAGGRRSFPPYQLLMLLSY